VARDGGEAALPQAGAERGGAASRLAPSSQQAEVLAEFLTAAAEGRVAGKHVGVFSLGEATNGGTDFVVQKLDGALIRISRRWEVQVIAMDSIARGSNNDDHPRLQHGAAPPIKPSPLPQQPPPDHIFGSIAIIFSWKGCGGAAGFEDTFRAFLEGLGGVGGVLGGVAALRKELQDVELLQDWKAAGVTFSDFVDGLGYLPVMLVADDEQPGWVRTGIAPNVVSAPAYKTHKDSSVGRFYSPMLRSLLLLKVGTLRAHLYPIAYPAAAAVPPAAAASSSSSPLPPATEPTAVVATAPIVGMRLHSDGNTGDQAAKIKVSVTFSGVYVKVPGLDNLAAARAEAQRQAAERASRQAAALKRATDAASSAAGAAAELSALRSELISAHNLLLCRACPALTSAVEEAEAALAPLEAASLRALVASSLAAADEAAQCRALLALRSALAALRHLDPAKHAGLSAAVEEAEAAAAAVEASLQELAEAAPAPSDDAAVRAAALGELRSARRGGVFRSSALTSAVEEAEERLEAAVAASLRALVAAAPAASASAVEQLLAQWRLAAQLRAVLEPIAGYGQGSGEVAAAAAAARLALAAKMSQLPQMGRVFQASIEWDDRPRWVLCRVHSVDPHGSFRARVTEWGRHYPVMEEPYHLSEYGREWRWAAASASSSQSGVAPSGGPAEVAPQAEEAESPRGGGGRGGGAYTCEICEFVFPTRQRLEHHMPTHTDERPFPCGLCSSAFKLKKHLTNHKC